MHQRRLSIAALEHTLVLPVQRRPEIPLLCLKASNPIVKTTSVCPDRLGANDAILGFRPSDSASKINSILSERGVLLDCPASILDPVHYRSFSKPSDLSIPVQRYISSVLSNALAHAFSDWVVINTFLFFASPISFLLSNQSPPYGTCTISEVTNWLGCGRITDLEAQLKLVKSLVNVRFGRFAPSIRSEIEYVLSQDRQLHFLSSEALAELSS